MSTEERLPPACAFAISVLAERDLDPEAVPEEAVEAAQQHMVSCARCALAFNPPSVEAPQRRKKKVRRPPAEVTNDYQAFADNPASQSVVVEEQAIRPVETAYAQSPSKSKQLATIPIHPEQQEATVVTAIDEGQLDCQQCRQLLQEYAEALDSGQNVASLYPEVQEHLLSCESGCLVLLDFFRQDAKATRKYRRRPIRDPFRVIIWELSGFFRTGQITVGPMALAYGTLILLLMVASLSAYLGVTINEARYHPHIITKPTPDGVGLSDGLKIFDACNNTGYQYKHDAAQEMQRATSAKADGLLRSAIGAVQTDTTGCNGAEAAIYRENLHVRQSGRPFSVVVVSFDSGPGNADPTGGTDRHILYAAYSQELVGAYIGQQQYNETQQKTTDAPLLYLVLANTAGIEAGALQVANTITALAKSADYQQFGLLAHDAHPLMGVLGFGPSSLLQVILPEMCQAGIPIIAPTSTGLFIVDLINQTSLYKHCSSGFGFVRFSPDDATQSQRSADYAYAQLNAHNVAVFYDPSNPSSTGSVQSFIDHFSGYNNAHIVARETAVASGLLDSNGRPQASREGLLAGLRDALQAQPDSIYAPLLTNDIITLAQEIARLPQNQQPTLVIGGEFVQPTALQGLVQWARQNQLTLPHIYISVAAAARPATTGDWQKQFYASFCTSFATPGSYCSGAAALDQGALLFGDGIKLFTDGIGSVTDGKSIPSRAQLLQKISTEQLDGVSCSFQLYSRDIFVLSANAKAIVLSVQGDGNIQIVG